jgi:hypothetical protein
MHQGSLWLSLVIERGLTTVGRVYLVREVYSTKPNQQKYIDFSILEVAGRPSGSL